jgi:hypothetical protein
MRHHCWGVCGSKLVKRVLLEIGPNHRPTLLQLHLNIATHLTFGAQLCPLFSKFHSKYFQFYPLVNTEYSISILVGEVC